MLQAVARDQGDTLGEVVSAAFRRHARKELRKARRAQLHAQLERLEPVEPVGGVKQRSLVDASRRDWEMMVNSARRKLDQAESAYGPDHAHAREARSVLDRLLTDGPRVVRGAACGRGSPHTPSPHRSENSSGV